MVAKFAKFCCICGSQLSNKRVRNPHNAKDEFCSQECAKKEREAYLEAGRKNFLLYAEGSAILLGVFDSINDLLRGAAYQTDVHRAINQPLGRLFYEVWVANYPQEAKEWDWVPTTVVTSFRKPST